MKLNIPLSVPNLSKDKLPMIEECITTGWVSTGGRFITEFENMVAEYVGVEDAVGVQSGSAGLHVAYRVMGVLNPLKLIITNYPKNQVEELNAENNPEEK